MKLDSTLSDVESNRAVSPVIGVILMVAITVILAAVIGAFVLEIGDQQETAPSTSFDTSEKVRYMNTRTTQNGWKINLTQVSITHAGGETLAIAQTEIKVEGNASVWGAKGTDNTYVSDGSNNAIEFEPAPNYCATAGTNEKVSFSSGQTWRTSVHYSESPVDAFAQGATNDPLNDDPTGCEYQTFGFLQEDGGGETRMFAMDDGGPTYQVGNLMDTHVQGDDVNVVWTAESGGKTQTLQRYTVQQSGDFS